MVKFNIMFTDNQKNFRVVKPEGKSVKIFETLTQSCSIQVGYPVKDAVWSGDHVVVYLESGEVRKYRSLSMYNKVG